MIITSSSTRGRCCWKGTLPEGVVLLEDDGSKALPSAVAVRVSGEGLAASIGRQCLDLSGEFEYDLIKQHQDNQWH